MSEELEVSANASIGEEAPKKDRPSTEHMTWIRTLNSGNHAIMLTEEISSRLEPDTLFIQSISDDNRVITLRLATHREVRNGRSKESRHTGCEGITGIRERPPRTPGVRRAKERLEAAHRAPRATIEDWPFQMVRVSRACSSSQVQIL
jgi:hypothetical protein